MSIQEKCEKSFQKSFKTFDLLYPFQVRTSTDRLLGEFISIEHAESYAVRGRSRVVWKRGKDCRWSAVY